MLSIVVDGLQLRIAEGEIHGRQSAVKGYKDCHRFYGWERIVGITPERPSFPLEFGSATHIFLALRGRGVDLDKCMQAGLERLTRDFPKNLFPSEEAELFEHRELAQSLWPLYEKYWSSDQDQIIPLGQETKFNVEVGEGTGVRLVGQTDKLVLFLNNLWISDYKTMSKNDDRNFQRFEYDIQPTAYTYGVTKALSRRVAGIIIDGLIKTKIPQFRREHYIKTDDELIEFEKEFPEVMKEIAWRHKRVEAGEDWKTVFYKNENHCMHVYGRVCPYRSLCTTDTPMARMAYRTRDKDYMDDPSLLNVAGSNDPEKKA